MNIDEPLVAISSALAVPGGRALPAESGRWHALFSDRQRPLLMPAGAYRLQVQSLRYFVHNRLKAFYARALLKANSLFPAAHFLPEFRLPREIPRTLPCGVATRRPSLAAIQIGSPGPYRKASVLLALDCGEEFALAKIAMVESADCMVAVEARWLRRFEGVRGLAGRVPKLLADGVAVNGRRYLVTTLAPSLGTTTEFTPAHAEFLGTLGRVSVENLQFGASPAYEYLGRTLARLGPCLGHKVRMRLEAALSDCAKSMSRWTGPFVIAQGDFAPWNIRTQRRGIFVFDWEYARRGANPLTDAFNFFLIQRALAGRRATARFVASVMHRVGAVASGLYPEWKWEPRVVSGLMLAHLLEILVCYSWAGKHFDLAHPVIGCYWRLVESRSTWMVA